MLGISGGNLHESSLKRLFVFRDALPRRHRWVTRCELGALWNPAFFLGAREGAFAIRVPAVVEFALIFVGPFLEYVVRTVDSAARPVHEERSVRAQRAVRA